MGIFSVCGRVATTILGMIGISALDWLNGKGLYFIFVLISFLAAGLVYRMPYCTLGRRLDSWYLCSYCVYGDFSMWSHWIVNINPYKRQFKRLKNINYTNNITDSPFLLFNNSIMQIIHCAIVKSVFDWLMIRCSYWLKYK